MNFTEILNIAGARHNAKMFETETDKQSGASRELDEQTARDILDELGLDFNEMLIEIGIIESVTTSDEISHACDKLRSMITSVIGE